MMKNITAWLTVLVTSLSMFGSFFALLETKWRVVGIIGAVFALVTLVCQLLVMKKERAQTFRGPKEINAYMMRWLESGGKTAIFTNDMTWAEDQEVFDALEAKAQRNELLVCASADNGRISKLASAGAVVTFREPGAKTSFTIVDFQKNGARVAVGRKINGIHTITEHSEGDVAFELANDLFTTMNEKRK